MSENHYVNEFFRQAREFEALEKSFRIGEPTQEKEVMAQVCKGLAEVCMMLAEIRCKEIEERRTES